MKKFEGILICTDLDVIHKIDASVFELSRYVAEHTSDIGIALVGFRNVYFYGDTPAVTKYRTDRKLPDLKCTIGEVGEPRCRQH